MWLHGRMMMGAARRPDFWPTGMNQITFLAFS
jgi:hypothetical protein